MQSLWNKGAWSKVFINRNMAKAECEQELRKKLKCRRDQGKKINKMRKESRQRSRTETADPRTKSVRTQVKHGCGKVSAIGLTSLKQTQNVNTYCE